MRENFDALKKVKFNGVMYEVIETEVTCTAGVACSSASASASAEYYSSSTRLYSSSLGSSSSLLANGNTGELGMSISGYCPCYIECVCESSAAWQSGLRTGDLIMRVNDVNCCRARLKSVLALIRRSMANGSTKLTAYRPLVASRPSTSTSGKEQMCLSSGAGKAQKSKPSVDKQPELVKKRSTVSTLKSKLLAKLFHKPSMWLSCAQPNNQTLHQSTFYFAPTAAPVSNSGEVIKPTVNAGQQSFILHPSGASGDTGYETLNIDSFPPLPGTLFQVS